MRRAAVGLWLTGVAAAGTALCTVCVPRAAPANAAVSAWKCDARDGVGSAAQVSYRLTVNGRTLKQAVLKPRDELATDASGVVDICLVPGQTACRLGANSVVRVLPSKGILLSIFRSANWVTCENASGTPRKVKTPQAWVIFDQQTRSMFASGEAGDSQTTAYSIGVGATRTKVEVGSGTVRVASGSRQVRLGCGEKAVARTGRAPQVTERQARIRKLWCTGQGRFRTRGRFSAATVRG